MADPAKVTNQGRDLFLPISLLNLSSLQIKWRAKAGRDRPVIFWSAQGDLVAIFYSKHKISTQLTKISQNPWCYIPNVYSNSAEFYHQIPLEHPIAPVLANTLADLDRDPTSAYYNECPHNIHSLSLTVR